MKYYLPGIICAIAIFWLSIMSSTSLPETLKDLFSLDKLGHAIAYGTLCATFYWGHLKTKGYLSDKALFYFALGAATYGGILEIIQYLFFPNRYFEVLDILANIMGILIPYVIYKLFFHKTTAP